MLSWEDLKPEFAWEGSWREILVRGTTLRDWEVALVCLQEAGLALAYSVGGVRMDVPDDVSALFPAEDVSRLLSVRTAAGYLNCHFFDESEILFDLDPRDVEGQAQLDAVLAFMCILARATGKPAALTPEGMHECVFVRVGPDGAMTYASTGGFFERYRYDE